MITLAPTDLLPDRPFTNPGHIPGDLNVLRYMLERVQAFLNEHRTRDRTCDHLQHPMRLQESDGRAHVYVIPNPAHLLKAVQLAVVGFFGHKRSDANPSHFDGLGDAILHEIPSYRDILGYHNMALDGENFSNLVLLRDDTVKHRWLEGKNHTEAVNRSPGYYSSVRIYNGTLFGGVAAPETMRLTFVKYYDYASSPPWRGERNLV
jgi:hypothetical protein